MFYLFNLFFLILKSCTGRIGRGQMIQNQVTPFFLFPFIFNFMCVFAYISVHHVYAMPVATRRRYWMPWGCESWKPNLGPLDNQPVLLPSAPSLPPHNSLTWFLLIMKLFSIRIMRVYFQFMWGFICSGKYLLFVLNSLDFLLWSDCTGGHIFLLGCFCSS